MYNLTIVSGGGSPIGDGLLAAKALTASPTGIIISNSEVIFCDTKNHRIRKIDVNGFISTIAGIGVAGYFGDGANALNAQLNSPQGIAIHNSGAIIFSDTQNHCIRKIENGIITTIAGTGTSGYTASGTATSVQLNTPLGLTVYNNEIYFADSGNHVIRKISGTTISNVVGVGGTPGKSLGSLVGPSNFQMNTPVGVIFESGTLYFSDSKNLRVCSVGLLVVHVAATTSSEPFGLGVYNRVVYAALSGGHSIVSVSSSSTPIIAGSGIAGFGGDGGLATSALLNEPSALTFDLSGNLFIADSGNDRIRKVINVGSSSIISTIAGLDRRVFGDGIDSRMVSLSLPNSVFYSIGDQQNEGMGVYIADMNNHVLRRLQNGYIYNIIGKVGIPNNSGTNNNGNINDALLNSPPFSMKQDHSGGSVFYLDNGGCSLWRILSSNDFQSRVMGSCQQEHGGDGAETYFLSKSFDISSDGVVYLADYFNHRIVKFTIGDLTLTTVAGGSTRGFSDGIGSSAELNYPDSISIGPNNVLYFSDRDNHAIRSLSTSSGLVTTIAGSGIPGYLGDGGPARSARLNLPGAITVTRNGEIIFMDKGNQRIRKITKYGNIFTIAGSGSTSIFNNANGLTLGGNGEIYIADTGNNYIKMLSSPICPNETTYNSSTFECQCASGYYEETCSEYDCSGVHWNSSLVCSGRGECLKPNTCNCSQPYFGIDCEQYTCYGVNVLNSSVCSSNGECTSPDNCTCSFGTFGLNCENAYCQGIVSFNSSVCNSRGTCIGYNKCTCNEGYYGSDCELYDCYGIMNTNSSVCSGNGICSQINNCSCFDGYYGSNCSTFDCVGEQFTGNNLCLNDGICNGPGDCKCPIQWGGSKCQYFKCYNHVYIDPKVCSGHGDCLSYNNCSCNERWFGNDCSTTTCFGIMSNDSSVCSAQGSCLDADECSCRNGYSGQVCEYRVCYDLIHTDPNVCSSHGSCVEPNVCQCENGFVGENCQYHQVFMDIPKALIYSTHYPLLNISRQLGIVNSKCQNLFDSFELIKLGENDLIGCIWTDSYFHLKLGYNHLIEHDSILQLNSNFNISLKVNSNSSLNSLNKRIFASSMDVLLPFIPSTQDFIVKSNNDDYYQTFKKVSKVWSCENCPQTLSNYLINNYENKSMILITSDLLNNIPFDSNFLKILSLKFTTMNSLQKLITSSDRTRVQNGKNLPPYFTWHGENVRDSQFSCVGHNCIVESSLNSLNSSLSFTFSGFFSLLNSLFSQKQMFRLVNVYNNELVDSEYSSNAQIVGFQLRTYVTTSLSYYFSYTTFDRLDHVLKNVNRTLSIGDGKFTISIYNEDPFIYGFTLPEYFTYQYECYQVNNSKDRKIIKSLNLCQNITNNQETITIDPISMGLMDGMYLINLTLTVSNSFVNIPYNYLGFVTLQSDLNVPKLTVDDILPAVYPSNKDLLLKVIIQSSTPISNFKWKLSEGIVKERSLIEQLFDNSQLVSLGPNTFKSEITISSNYLLEGEFISFDFSVLNENGFSNISLSTRIDQTPRFSCEYFNLKNDLTNYAFESLLAISCFNLPEEPISSFNMEFHSTNGGHRINVISNTMKKNIVTRIPMFGIDENISLIVKLVNRYGSISQVSRPVSVSPPIVISNSGNSLISRFNYVNQHYSNLKSSEPLRIDTSNSINSLISILIQNETLKNFTNQLVNELNSNQISNLENMLKDMIVQLKNIQSLTFKVDEKIIQLVLPTLSRIYQILDNLSMMDESWVSDISTWIDWIYSGMSSAKQYYSPRILSTILSNEHFSELKSIQDILSNRFSNRLDKQQSIANYRAQFLLLTGMKMTDSSYLLESVDIASQLNGKSITSSTDQDIQIITTLPSDLTTQIPNIPNNAQLFYSSSIITSDKTLNNILTNRPVIDMSIYSKEGKLISVNNLNNPIVMKFINLWTDYKVNTNLTCVYFDVTSQTWSGNGISFKPIITKQENGKLFFDMECNTTHLSLFSIQEFNFIYPENSTLPEETNDMGMILGLALGISIPLLMIMILIVVIVVLLVFVWKLKKKSNDQMVKNDLEMNDFPSDTSMFLTPLVSVSGNTSNNESFNPLSRYLDLQRIGQGAFGSVFKAMDSKTNTLKAIKVIRYQSNEELNGFMKEGTQLMNVNHPNILKVNDFFVSQDNLLCIDMDFYEKGDLVQLTNESFVCSEELLLKIIYQMLNALEYIHRTMKLIHRDIKPSNIFIKSIDNENIHIVIADFGLARADQGSAHKSYAGTPLFMSPELGYGGKYFFNTDIYSLGVTLYQIMTKDIHTSISQLLVTKDKLEVNGILRQKFEESNIYSTHVIDLVISMLEKDMALRPQAHDLLNTLNKLVN